MMERCIDVARLAKSGCEYVPVVISDDDERYSALGKLCRD